MVFHDTLRQVPISCVTPRASLPFSLEKFSLNEDSLQIWTSLFYLASQAWITILNRTQ
jgi:hypothetical protein